MMIRYTVRQSPFDDLQLVCFHESGHAIVGAILGLTPKFEIIPTGKKNDPHDKAFRGHTGHFGPGTPELDAVAGWAGPIAECKFLGEAFSDYEHVRTACSPTDAKNIMGHPYPEATFARALSMVIENWSRITAEAEAAIEDSKSRFAEHL
jgi:hypothetical protein